MLKTIQYHEISLLDKYIVRVRGMFRSDGTITQSEAMMLAFFDEIRDKIAALGYTVKETRQGTEITRN